MKDDSGSGSILVVDDERASLEAIERTLRMHGLPDAILCEDSEKVMDLLRDHRIAVVLLDLIMPLRSGQEVLAEIRERYPDLPVIVVTGETDLDTAVSCMRSGADDYIVKPIEPDRLAAAVRRMLEQSALRYEAARLRELFCAEQLTAPEAFADILTADPAMLRMFAYLEAVSRGSQPLLITGETGTGKELIARALHLASGRTGPFVAVNVAGLDDNMFSDTLFGHVAGAFTGAASARTGAVEQANDGTLFLDEIGDLAESSQVKLLRLLQEREYHALGSDRTKRMSARVVAATLQDPEKLRRDLFYRLRLYHVRIPPLRERLGDLPQLVALFLREAAEDLGRSTPAVPAELYLELANYDFQGNVRELRAIVFDAVARSPQATVPLDAFLSQLGGAPAAPGADGDSDGEHVAGNAIRFPFPLPTMREIERAALAEALQRLDGNRSAAARMLDISRTTVARHLKD